MNRTDRLMAIVLTLQAKGATNATVLAQQFGTSRRTIYRDIQALCEASVPIYADNDGYRLSDDYFLPPLALTVDEAVLLVLGADAVGRTMDADYAAIAQQAVAKISAILPEERRQQVERLRDSLLIVNDGRASTEERVFLGVLRVALLRSQTVSFRYLTRYPGDGHVTRRSADPYLLASVSGVWFLTAYCHLRKDLRRFRLSRMQDLKLLPERFKRQPDYEHESQQERMSSLTTTVELLFSDDVTQWVMEDSFYYIQQREETDEGLHVVLHCHHLDEIRAWVLGWGAKVRVLSPQALVEQVVEQSQAVLEQYRTVPDKV